ncbi:2Fe-2S iron-sulfur cluster-binding protein [Hydrogenophaga sp. BPS33]|uniref:2Fe-2S iron-sulfur cluster-binding protein n=1 Tax=Hydrogenophaga sp. BPS33 TaxID=2651974 RepID=UPI00131FF5A4|nr:2Fe-2S iron-sulfur cluster-binding protein [Hydrogenophaga sp. BPS33]QHE84151.1 2Fe-2S iron-sulfur cluster binding domain-containing protein [Hydrogenophaga sp. BPS33]
MPKITFVQPDGREQTVEIPLRSSLMQGAVDHLIEGIVGECAGSCSCGTCMVHVEDPWMEKVGAACSMESQMMGEDRTQQRNARLSCQIEVTDELDGMRVTVGNNEI